MRRKQILIGLFALIIYRTIGEPKKLQGGRERAFVNTCFLRPATAGTGILGVVFAQLAMAGTGANGLIFLDILNLATVYIKSNQWSYTVHFSKKYHMLQGEKCQEPCTVPGGHGPCGVGGGGTTRVYVGYPRDDQCWIGAKKCRFILCQIRRHQLGVTNSQFKLDQPRHKQPTHSQARFICVSF